MRLTLSRHQCTFAHFNARSELNGDERVPAADLKIQTTIPNTLLDGFHPELCAALYLFDGAQDDLPNIEQARKVRRFHDLAAFPWGGSIVGARVTLHIGVTGDQDVELVECTIDKFVIEALEGGSVKIAFRIKCEPSEHDAGKLYTLSQKLIELSIECPSAETQAWPFTKDY